jgi:hypothetical protein
MDNTVSVFSTLATASLVALLAIQCIQNNVEGFTPEEAQAHNQNLAAAASAPHNEINQRLEDGAGMPKSTNLDVIQNKGFMLASSVDQGSMGSLPAGVSMYALNQPAATVASSLLPHPTPDNQNQTWADPSGVSNALANSSMLSALDIIGVNTTASSLRNPSLDLRGDPVCNPRDPVSVFNNSSITCTLNRPLTCYEDLPRPTIWSCDWNNQWWNKLDGVKPMASNDLPVSR